MASSEPDIRDVLKDLGSKRTANREQRDEIAAQIERALVRAKDQGVSKTEAASLVGVHRTTLYRVYDG